VGSSGFETSASTVGVDALVVACWSAGRDVVPELAMVGPLLGALGPAEGARRSFIYDAEQRLARGQRARLEDYAAVVPQVLRSPSICRAILMCEAASRGDEDQEALGRELRARFPQLGPEVETVMGFMSFAGESMGKDEPLEAGARLGKYELRERLGAGSFGEVWRADDTELRRSVALKVLFAEEDAGAAVALLAEARAAAAVSHEHAVTVHDAGMIEGRACIDTALVGDALPTAEGLNGDGGRAVRVGWSLHDEVKRHGERMSDRRAAALMEPVARAVAAAHARGVLHRDLKPSNVLVTPSGKPMVADFGLAAMGGAIKEAVGVRVGDAPGRVGRLVGTPGYMAPEQARGEAATPLSDVFGLGATLRFILTGRPTYEPSGRHSSDARLDVLAQARLGERVALDESKGKIHPDLRAIVNRATASLPSERYTSADQFAADLRAFLGRRPTLARPAGTARAVRMWARRHASPVLVGVVALVVIMAGTVRSVSRIADERDRARLAEEQAKAALVEAARQRDVALTLNRFTAEVTGAALKMNLERPVTLLETLALADRRANYSLTKEPLQQAGARHFLGGAALAVGDPIKAREHLMKAVEIRTRELGPEAADTLRSRRLLGMTMVAAADAADAADAAAAAQAEQGKPEPKVAIDRPATEVEMATLLPLLEKGLGGDDPDSCAARIIVAMGALRAGDLEEAERLFRRSAEGLSKGGNIGTIDWQDAAWNLGNVIMRQGREEEGLDQHRTVVQTAVRVLGKEDIRTLNTRNNFAKILIEREKLDEAEVMLREFAGDALALGENHPGSIFATTVYGEFMLQKRRNAEEGLRLARLAIPDRFRASVGAAARYRADLLAANALVALGRPNEATAVLREAVADGEKRKLSGSPGVKAAAELLGRLENSSRTEPK